MKNGLRGIIRSIADTADQVAGASDELSGTSQAITANSEETSSRAQIVSMSSDEVNLNLQTVHAVVKGAGKRIRVCTSCIRNGKVVKAPIA